MPRTEGPSPASEDLLREGDATLPEPPGRAPRLEALRLEASGGSLDSSLGAYYLDLRPVIPLIESGYHGRLDSSGVPLTEVTPGGQQVYNTITIAQYALALHDELAAGPSRGDLEGRLQTQLDALLAHMDRDGPLRGFAVHRWDNAKYREVRSPWVSAMAQGNGLSALLRGYQRLGVDRYLEGAHDLFEAMQRPVESGGVSYRDPCGHLWLEEYPTRPPTRVLNGFIFALWGALDYARATGSAEAWGMWKQGLDTLRAHLQEFDAGFWSVYDLRYRELVSRHYHLNIHVPQLQVMHTLTGEDLYRHFAARWVRFGASPWRRALWWCALRWQAWTRGYAFD
jgi:heparosan-N-sulfate-glucuronate 5-epimerase